MKKNRRKDSRIENQDILQYLNIENDDNEWIVLDYSINGLRIKTNNMLNYKINQIINMSVGFRSGKHINIKGIIKRINKNENNFEMGIEIIN